MDVVGSAPLRYEYGIQQIPAVLLFESNSQPREYYTVGATTYFYYGKLAKKYCNSFFWLPRIFLVYLEKARFVSHRFFPKRKVSTLYAKFGFIYYPRAKITTG